jgi:hypothetical protein
MARDIKPRYALNSRVAEVVSEKTTTRTIKRRGAPYEIHELEVVLLLVCGHKITRTLDLSKEPAVGRRARCDECFAAASATAEHHEAAGAS